MYDYDEYSGSDDYSFENSDCEYATLEPYVYEINRPLAELMETSEEKLLKYIHNNLIIEIKSLVPCMLKDNEKLKILPNGVASSKSNGVYENGDGSSDNSDHEVSDFEDEEKDTAVCKSKYQEIFLKNGDTPLMAAAAEGNAEMVSYFLSLGFDVNYKLQNSNKTALLSLFCKANLNMCSHDRNSNSINNLLKCLKILIDAGCDVQTKGFLTSVDYGNTALHYAVQNNYWDMLEILIHAGAEIDAMNNQKMTPLQMSASRGYVSCCNILLLNGANAKFVDKTGNMAADLAELEGYHHLSDAINVYCGNAQHNVRLYQTWRQYTPNLKNYDLDNSFTDVGENSSLNHSCIESFCLSLDAPYLSKLMEDQGISIGDLKYMDESKLQELGVPSTDCKRVIVALKDLNKMKSNSKKINFSYGKPLKPITMLEMIGNIGEHIEFVDTNLESMLCHLNRNEKFYLEKYRIVNKSTVNNLKSNSQNCISVIGDLIKQSDHLKNIINEQQNQDKNSNHIKENGINSDYSISTSTIASKHGSHSEVSRLNISICVTSVIAISIGVVLFSKRYLWNK